MKELVLGVACCGHVGRDVNQGGTVVSRSSLVGLKSALVAILLGVVYLIISRIMHFGSEGLFSYMVVIVYFTSASAYKKGLKDQLAGRVE